MKKCEIVIEDHFDGLEQYVKVLIIKIPERLAKKIVKAITDVLAQEAS